MSITNIAFSGLQAARMGMNVTSMNIANTLTPGYSRQVVQQSSIGPMGQVGLAAGNGVQVDSIRRVSDQYLVGQVWHTNGKASYYNAGQQYLGALEKVVGNESTSLGSGLDEFFASLSAMTTQPESPALRQQALNQANSLAMRFNNTNDFINSQKTSIAAQREASVENINVLSSNIASYNQKISEMEASGGNASALRDQRDELVKQLSGFADVKISEDHAGRYTVALKGGQPLVSGNTSGQLAVGKNSDGSTSINLQFGNSEFSLNPSMGGQLGALHDYESGPLKNMQDSIQGMAQTLADMFNSQLEQGFDLNGNPGKPLFVFDPSNPGGMLQVNNLKPEELALSSQPGEAGNGDNLLALVDLKNKKSPISGMGDMSLNEGAASIISGIGIASRENQTELEAATAIFQQAQIQRDNLSGVNNDEEAINLQVYMHAYQANLKVIATGDQIFSDLLNLF
ncbi:MULTISPECIES: flagellar hook-associated protein FlgK [unclassified Serratia (in: enterobacteria)]|uniref:flagellar hook-associated protein FlgK n=1 Tax=unclassified Serratia (in: enterobacteria) TaxID=2647522 RepID=UPI0005080625|nr:MULTISPECIES: flagellar hook-associated protein FlgK [unclassified Serratia (in: enterobacteria)]KFK95342.1 flagellar hook protein FlgK [Serratia sp. Ag2]KFK98690.1 flagellar hook protein FlgK [Serratia sp. Ag1]